MRTWTLQEGSPDGLPGEAITDGPDLADDESVDVIELAPILDLLGRLEQHGSEPFGEGRRALEELKAILEEHGRLT